MVSDPCSLFLNGWRIVAHKRYWAIGPEEAEAVRLWLLSYNYNLIPMTHLLRYQRIHRTWICIINRTTTFIPNQLYKVLLDRMIKFIEYIANDGHDAANSSEDQ